MTKRRTTSERIAELEKRESQICAQKKLLQKKEAEENRKARTKRLIMIGAEVEKILDQRSFGPFRGTKLWSKKNAIERFFYSSTTSKYYLFIKIITRMTCFGIIIFTIPITIYLTAFFVSSFKITMLTIQA
jgi:hypothetical protein